MFGFSATKLLFTVAAIAIVWWGFRWLGRVQRERRDLAKREARRMKEEGAAAQARSGGNPGVEDMVECRECGSFVASSGARNCGRADCPYPG